MHPPTHPIDPKSITGKFPPTTERAQLGIVGAGPAGVAAALAAARAGQQVMLIDENPVEGALMGMDVPLPYGNRMTAAVQRQDRMLEQVFLANPDLAEAVELGVDLRLGVTVWGAFANGPNLKALPGPVLGLADAERSWLVGFDRLILAAGARDLVFTFPGADQPGVIGANALHSLLTRYDAFAGHRIVVLGSGALGLDAASRALDHGREVAAIIEPRDVPQGPAEAVAALHARGVPILTGCMIQRAHGDAGGVSGVTVAGLNQPSGAAQDIRCDTVCLAVDLVPNIELAHVLGCATVFDPARGGHVPRLDAEGRTSLPFVSAVGDCAGLDVADPEYRLDWMRALLATGGLETLACQCEEVTRREILGVRPPRYLGGTDRADPRSLEALAADGPLDPDQIKRLTRAGMGPCQGRRCREQVALLLSVSTGTPVGQIPLATYRAPVRPLPLSVLQQMDEPEALAANWEVWFGIPGQWVPYRDIGTERERVDRYGQPVDHDHM